MTKIEDIEKAIWKLAPDEFARLRAWFLGVRGPRFDEATEVDARSGRLDQLAAEAPLTLPPAAPAALKSRRKSLALLKTD